MIQEINANWKNFYHNSPLRENILCWYPFSDTDRVLEVGCGQGALTKLLCDRCAFVDTLEKDPASAVITQKKLESAGKNNFRMYQTDIMEFRSAVQYDKIVVVEFLEAFQGGLTALFSELLFRLKETGVMLLGFRNRYAVRYSCGIADEYTKVKKDVFSAETHLYSRKEVEDALKEAGFSDIRCYYPLPDLLTAQVIYSDEWIPEDLIKDRVITYDPFKNEEGSRALLEKNTLDQIVRDRMLKDLSNCFFMECRLKQGKTDEKTEKITGAVLSADRERAHAFATLIIDNQSVEKKALFPEGETALLEMNKNAEDLKAKGVCVVPHHLISDNEQSRIRMPYVTGRRLVDHLGDLIKKEPASVLPILRMLYVDILKAGGITDADSWSDEMIRQRNPVLKPAYIDMIPYNAFWEDGKIRYFDQEFTEEEGEAKYVLYRALRYTWLHISEAEKVISLEKVIHYFGLQDLWNAYSIKEDAFTEKNRNRLEHRQFYKWAWESSKPYQIGFVMGVFDLLHYGHLVLFRNAKSRCQYLRVGVLSDELTEKYKNKRPVIPLEERMEILKSITYVDEVTAVDGDYVSKVAEWYKRPFDCFFSGDDHADNEYWMKEKQELKLLGAEIEFFPYTREISSSMIRNRLNEKTDGNG